MLKVIVGERAEEHDGIKFPEKLLNHPNESFEYAYWVVYGSRFVNLTIITNNPYLIEAISLWSEYLKISVEYYLHDNKTDLTEIKFFEIYKIYDNLGKVYDRFDELKLTIEFRGE